MSSYSSTLKCLYFVCGDAKIKYKFDQEVPWHSTETIIRERFNLSSREKLNFLDTADDSIISNTLLARLPSDSVICVESVPQHNSSINKIYPVGHNEKELKEFTINDRSFSDNSNQLKMSDQYCQINPTNIITVMGEIQHQLNIQQYELYNMLKFARRKLDLPALSINSNNVLNIMPDIYEKYLVYAQAHQLKNKMVLSS
ncbi:hypothetical protein I4U23_020770 [Adineta vaga]|nr:hypothetical protein I4U23_020770 [Adineta vaga]